MKVAVFALSILLATQAWAEAPAPGAVTEKLKPEGDSKAVVGSIQEGVYFIEPKDGAVVAQKFKVKMGVYGMRVKPAGELELGTGHHHIIVDNKEVVKAKGMAENTVIPKDEQHFHYGKGEEETELELKPGKHTLTLQFADGAHRSLGPKWAKTITIKVKK